MTGKMRLADLPVEGRRVFVRVDFNVPLRDGEVTDDRRIRASIPTLEQILARGGRPVVASHLGRPKGKRVESMSLRPVAARLASLIAARLQFQDDCVGEAAGEASATLGPGELLLLENLRFHPEEEKNDEQFSRALAALADLYVNDAFGSAHRAHASTAGICRFVPQSAAGLLMEREVSSLSRLLEGAERPYVAVLGGAKVADKIPLARNLLGRVDGLLIGGAMAYTFLKAQGVDVGASIVETEQIGTADALLAEAAARGVDVRLPVDHVIVGTGDESVATAVGGAAIPAGHRGVDIGPRTVERFLERIAAARTILWNGPLGWFETAPYDKGTRDVVSGIAASGAFTVAGGGDSAAALAAFGLESRFSHVSTGGGASLEFLSGLTLPGVAALTDRT